MEGNVKVRIAPSPTGFFHVGSARTALYNWLFARHHKGKFLLRVEDTDVVRSSVDMIQILLEGLTWLGLHWDEEPVYQSQRIEVYNKYVKSLLEKKMAYYCYCRSEDLEKEKQHAYAHKQDWQYDRRCLRLSEEEKKDRERAGVPKAVRFLMPDTPISYTDLVFGHISREAKDIEDFVILRADNSPTYNLACVVDDHEMNITHVIRGADHIANTPKQIALYNALHIKPPEFAHLPLILGPDRSKLSKRHGAVSVTDYRNQGFVSDAIVNYLALLGWSPGDDTEFMKKDILVERFSVERINSSNAVFDIDKMTWLNQQHLMQLDLDQFKQLLSPFIINANLMTSEEIRKKETWFTKVCSLLQPRLKVLSEVDTLARYFFKDDFQYNKEALDKHLNQETIETMKDFITVLQHTDPFSADQLEHALRTFTGAKNIKAKAVIHPLRVFTTGTSAGPSLFETLELIGKDRCIQRVNDIVASYRRP
jgi:nondiscriminating glutamyl-tRNA synthetase